MSELRNMVEESVVKLFDDTVDREFLMEAEEKGFSSDLWATVIELGIDRVLASEANAGMGGTWSDAYPVVRACGLYGVPLPIPEAIVSTWLQEQAGLSIRDGIPGLLPIALPESADPTSLTVEIPQVPWGRQADFFVGLQATDKGSDLVIIDSSETSVSEEQNLSRDPRDIVSFNNAKIAVRGPTGLAPDAVRWLAALMRSAQIAGAGSACLKLGLDYTSEREQFGRPLARFQAIQHHLANMSGELATVEAMSATAFGALEKYGLAFNAERDAKFDIAAAKCRASDAVEPLTKIGHQVHGAIGFTFEYGLHFLTRRLWSWRAEFGGSSEWARYLGQVAVDAGGDGIWSVMTK
jgi:acyl-CoA dehydrogenase